VGLGRIVSKNALSGHPWTSGLVPGVRGVAVSVIGRCGADTKEGISMTSTTPTEFEQGAQAEQAAAERDPLLGIDQEVRDVFWQGLIRALEPALWLVEQTPLGTRHPLPQRVLEHLGDRLNARWLRKLAREHLRRLLKIEVGVTLEVLETLLLDSTGDGSHAPLAAACTRVGQVYAELKRRHGMLLAYSLLRWELRLLTYRASPAAAALAFKA
jgi:hypothetical protein